MHKAKTIKIYHITSSVYWDYTWAACSIYYSPCQLRNILIVTLFFSNLISPYSAFQFPAHTNQDHISSPAPLPFLFYISSQAPSIPFLFGHPLSYQALVIEAFLPLFSSFSQLFTPF